MSMSYYRISFFGELFTMQRYSFGLILIKIYCFFLFSKVNTIKRINLSEDYAKAFDHGARVRTEGACQHPQPLIVYVNKTDPSKVHLPRGTVLHRCNDLTGCCSDPLETCTAIEKQTIELYFITITLKKQSTAYRQRRIRQSPQIEKILFTNHTRCGCRVSNRSDQNEIDLDDENEIL